MSDYDRDPVQTTVGILGGGQLGRMLSLAGYPLGMRFRHLDPKPGSPTSSLDDQVQAEYDDPEALDEFARGVDVVTYEFENVPVESARRLQEHVDVHPPPEALEVAQDRLPEKEFFRDLGMETAPYRRVDSRDDLNAALANLGPPAVLKTRRGGYDGKGQRILRTGADVEEAWEELGGRPLLLEGMVDFEREVSILGVRGRDGDTAFYPLVENHHLEGILYASHAPAPDTSPEVQEKAEEYSRRALEALDYVGVLAIEFFQVSGGRLLANEMAPRVHNSGHWSIEGAETSQFENHMRAVAGLPLGLTDPVGHTALVNVLGTIPEVPSVLEIPGAHLHLYEKSPRPRRKLGHVTIRCDDEREAADRVKRLHAVLKAEEEARKSAG